jgi:hypothetical protein
MKFNICYYKFIKLLLFKDYFKSLKSFESTIFSPKVENNMKCGVAYLRFEQDIGAYVRIESTDSPF